MNSDFEIKYRFHWCGPCEEFGDTKEETIIRSDGSVSARSYDHHGPNGHFRLIERASGSVEPENVSRLYAELLNIAQSGDLEFYLDDTYAEIIITKPGVKISIDSGMTHNEQSCRDLIEHFMRDIHLEWETVR